MNYAFELHPEIEEKQKAHLINSDDQYSSISNYEKFLFFLGRLVNLKKKNKILVVGCGPRPEFIEFLKEKSFEVKGIEPVEKFVNAANEYLATKDVVVQGSAEQLPEGDESHEIIILDSVMEHVDSPHKCLNEAFRILKPGGVLYIQTTNRYRVVFSGKNNEYRIRYYQYLPDFIKESYVHHHLHRNPTLANYSARPAVHWYTFNKLCRLGRAAGFSRFFSRVDLYRPDDDYIRSSFLKRILLVACIRSPFLRALVLTQTGSVIFMYKRE